MQNTQPILTGLYQVFDRFEKLLATKTEAEITAPSLQDGWSIQDVIGHLRAWQQVSIARLEAGNSGGVPVFPDWLQGHDPDEDDDNTCRTRNHTRRLSLVETQNLASPQVNKKTATATSLQASLRRF